MSYINNISHCITSATELMNGNLSLIPYSHIPVIIISLLIGFFVITKNYKLKSAKILFTLSLLFSIWVTFNMIAWISSSSVLIMFFWSLFGTVDSLIFLTSLYLVYSFLNINDLKLFYKILLLILILPIILLTPTIYNVSSFNYTDCYANDNLYFGYSFIVKGLAAILLLIVTAYRYIKTVNLIEKKQVLLMSLGNLFFLLSFFSFGYFADTFELYSLEIYGVFSMIIFMAFLAYLIVKYKAFNIKLLGAQALMWGITLLVGSQFFFIKTTTNKILTGITLFITVIAGYILVKSVKKVDEQRDQLEVSNNNQQALIHFISHQIKGFFTKSKIIFAGLIEGDFGEVNPTVVDMAKTGLISDNNAVAMIQDILGASNLRNGTINYTFKKLDLSEIVIMVASSFKDEINRKGVNYEFDIATDPLYVMADKTQITQAIKNVIDNSMRYTINGEVKVSLSVNPENKNQVIFSVIDTGIGLSEGDKSKLFTEGGKGEESLKVNTNSTGYGLFIAKKIIDTHHGKIWAESAGRGHGSRFYVELELVR